MNVLRCGNCAYAPSCARPCRGRHSGEVSHASASCRRRGACLHCPVRHARDGIRAYSIADPAQPKEIGYFVPKAPPGNATHTIQINDVYLDEHGLIYANDRLSGGLYIVRYTGESPLN